MLFYYLKEYGLYIIYGVLLLLSLFLQRGSSKKIASLVSLFSLLKPAEPEPPEPVINVEDEKATLKALLLDVQKAVQLCVDLDDDIHHEGD